MTCRVSGEDAVMKLFLILLAIGLLFVVTGCGGKGNTLNILPKSSASVNQGKNPGGTGRIVGGTVTVYAEPTVKIEIVSNIRRPNLAG